MNEPIQQLLDEAEEIFASGKGTKAELARFIGVTPPRVQEWFTKNSNRHPNGNSTLLIEKWVNEKKNAPEPDKKKKLPVKRAVFLTWHKKGHINE